MSEREKDQDRMSVREREKDQDRMSVRERERERERSRCDKEIKCNIRTKDS